MAKTISQFKISDMNCNHCVQGIDKALKKVPGVTAVKADLAQKTIAVEHDSAQAPSNVIVQALENAGHEVAAL